MAQKLEKYLTILVLKARLFYLIPSIFFFFLVILFFIYSVCGGMLIHIHSSFQVLVGFIFFFLYFKKKIKSRVMYYLLIPNRSTVSKINQNKLLLFLFFLLVLNPPRPFSLVSFSPLSSFPENHRRFIITFD